MGEPLGEGNNSQTPIVMPALVAAPAVELANSFFRKTTVLG
jgi:hypothetical protein